MEARTCGQEVSWGVFFGSVDARYDVPFVGVGWGWGWAGVLGPHYTLTTGLFLHFVTFRG